MKETKETKPDEIQSLVDTYKINKTLKLNTVNTGEPTDNILVHRLDNEVKSIPRSELGGVQSVIGELVDNTDPNFPDSYIEMNYVDGNFSTNIINIQPNIIATITNYK